MSKPKVAALVLNYNGKDITLQTVASLRAMTYPNYVVAVIDNGSTDGSPQALATAFPGLDQILVEVNEGPAAGINAGLRWALERDFDYLLVLNNDIEVAPSMLDEMMAVAESDPTIGCVGPKCLYFWDRERIWSAGGRLRFGESVTKERGMGELDRGQFDRTMEVDYVTGCSMLVPRRVPEEIGLWDPVFFLSVEDADWCTRMKRRGYRCFYAHKAVLWHMVSQSVGTYVPAKTFHNGRSTAIFVRRYANPWQWLRFLFLLSLAIPAAYLRELPKGNQAAAVAKLKGVWAGLRERLVQPPRL
jgi:GT2 family glycosyltransferase